MQFCEWFVKCIREAAGVVHHPVIGNVPTCRECADLLGLDLQPFDSAASVEVE